jgi:hypothetical protein
MHKIYLYKQESRQTNHLKFDLILYVNHNILHIM